MRVWKIICFERLNQVMHVPLKLPKRGSWSTLFMSNLISYHYHYQHQPSFVESLSVYHNNEWWFTIAIIVYHFWPMFPFYTPWKHQKTCGFQELKKKHWPQMSWLRTSKRDGKKCIWVKVFKNEPRKICRKQPLQKLK